jgi:hypothetical protein
VHDDPCARHGSFYQYLGILSISCPLHRTHPASRRRHRKLSAAADDCMMERAAYSVIEMDIR